MTLTFDKQISLQTLPSWNGAGTTTGTTTVTEARTGDKGNAQLTIGGITGQIDMGANSSSYLANNGSKTVIFNATWTLTSGTSLLVTVGPVSTGGGNENQGPAQDMTFAPALGLHDRAGNQEGGSVPKTAFRPF
jgi:hypothetical protein